MEPLMITTGINVELIPSAYRTSLNGAKVSALLAVENGMVYVQTELPPPENPFMERLRQEFAAIEPRLKKQQAKILRFMLDTPNGQATYRELTAKVWPGKIPMQGCVRQAVLRLRRSLILHKASHVVFGSRNGVFSFVPTQIEETT